MSAIDDIRAKYPEYNKYSDQELADALHQKSYADRPKEEFYQAIGFDPAINKRTTEGMGTWEGIKELTRTGAQYGAAKLAAIPQDIGAAEMTHFNQEDLAAAHDEWLAANPDKPQLGKYTYNPEMYDLAKQKAMARDPNARRPVFGETVSKFSKEHLLSADDVLRHMAEVDKAGGGTGEFTRPTEASGRVLQHGVEAATMAAPALLTGQPEALLAAGGAAAGGQGAREAGAPEWLAQGLEVGGSMITPGGLAATPRTVARLAGATIDRTLPASATKLLNEAVKGMTEEELNRAQNLMRRAEGQNNQLTWAEAANQVTEGRIKALTDLQRVVEASGGNDALNQVMAGRRAATETNVEGQAATIGQGPALSGPEAASLPRRLGTQAELGVRDLERGRQAQVGPIFQRGERTTPDAMMGGNFDDWQAVVDRPAVGDAFRRAQNITRNRGEPITRWIEWQGDTPVVTQMPSATEVDSMHKSLQAMINDPNVLTDQRSGFIAARDALDELANQAIPEYQQGRALHRELSGPITDVQRGPLGTIADAGGTQATGTAEEQFRRQSEALLPKKPQITDPVTARTTTRQLRQGYDPETRRPIPGAVDPAANQAVGQILRNKLNDAVSQFKTKMAPQDAGAAFKIAVSGNPQQRAILQQVITEAAGDDVWRGFSNMLDVFEAQGWRQAPGSQTTFNQMIRDTMEQSRLPVTVSDVANIAASGGKSLWTKGLKSLETRGRQGRGAATVDELATRLLDPNSRPILRQLATMSPYSPNAARLVAQLLAVGGTLGAGQGPQVQEAPSPGVAYQ